MSDLEIQLRERLHRGLVELAVHCDSVQCEKLLHYVLLLQKWNRVYNLTAVREPLQMISRHLLDSLTLLPLLEGDRLLDVGSGAGLPGIPIAVARPDLDCTLLDSSHKKTRFIQQVVAELGLTNVRVVHARIERLEQSPFDTIVSRAFSAPVDIIRSAGHLCVCQGIMVFMLGQALSTDLSWPEAFELVRMQPVKVPFEIHERHLAVARRVDQQRTKVSVDG